jgi:HPt (histidine-containing phosphotransfer) domain-containing protein
VEFYGFRNEIKKSGDNYMDKSFKKLIKDINIDFEAVDERFDGDEEMIIEFLKKFENDNTFYMLEKAVEEYDIKAMMVYSHDLKGLCANLGIIKLSSLCKDMSNELKNNILSNIPSRFNNIRKEYLRVIHCIKKL